jgi:hypothetical protein
MTGRCLVVAALTGSLTLAPTIDEDSDFGSFELTGGVAVTGGVGYELVQTPHVALGLEATGTAAHYPDQWWRSAGLNFTVASY